MMSSENPQRLPEDAGDDLIDARIRECLSTLPSPPGAADVERRVLAKLRRRKTAAGATCAVSLVVALAVAWAFFAGDRNPRQPNVADNHPPTGDTEAPAGAPANDVALFASAYSGLPSPVAELNALDHESEALLNYLGSLETKEDQK